MSFNGDLWSSVNRIASQQKMNLKNNIVGTGDQILAKSPGSLQVGIIASVTTASTGGALQPGIYRWNGSNWVSPQGGIHTHTSTSDGGSFKDLLVEAIETVWYANRLSVTDSMFGKSGTIGTGTYTTVVSGTDMYAQILTGTTSSNAGNFHYGGTMYTFASKSAFTTRIQLADSTVSSQARCGMNMEKADVVTDNKPKYGFEGCSTCNSSSMSIISANGTLRSKNTTSADNYATVGNFIMDHTPGVNTRYRKETGSIIIKTTEPPSTGTSDRSNGWICGIQTATTAAKTLKLYGFEAIAQKDTSTWPSL